MDVFQYQNYQKYLNDYLQALPKQGFGMAIKIAKAINTNPSIVSQVLAGKMDFTIEQANDLVEYLGLSELEADYFLNLVLISRSGKLNLRERLVKKNAELKEKSRQLSERMPAQGKLGEIDQSIFYSHWYYSGIRLATSIDKYQSLEEICNLFNLPRAVVRNVLDFLLRTGLCIEENGHIKMGPQSTHIGNESLLVNRHHINWRQKSIEVLSNSKSNELFFTSPFSVAENDIEKIRTVLFRAIDDAFKIINPSPSERLACLNIDLFRLK